MSLPAFRQGVQDQLAAGLGITVDAGQPLFDRSEDRDIGYVWVDRIAEDPTDVQIEVITLGVQVFKQWKIQQGLARPVDDFENLVEQIQTSLKGVQTSLGPWMFRLVELVPDYENMNVSATIEARQDNLFSQGG